MGRSSKNMPKKNSDELIKESYKKQRKRLQNAIYRAKKQGYIFPDNILPKVPKKIEEASAKRLAKIKPEDLRKKARYLIEETGEIIPVKGNKSVIKQEIARKRQQNKENIPKISYIEKFKEKIDELFGSIDKFKNDIDDLPDYRAFYHGRSVSVTFKDLLPYKSLFLSLLNDRIAENGEEEVERLLFEHSTEIEEKFSAITYDSKEEIVDFCLNSVASLLKSSPLSQLENEMVTLLSEGDYENVDE